MSEIIDPFQLQFMQRAALEIVLLAPLAGLLGAQIVLRRLAFYTHGVGAGTFPGLVLAGPLGIPPALAAFGVAGLFAFVLERVARGARLAYDAGTALLLVAALATGIILASDVYSSGSEVDQLLFGSLLAIGDEELLTTGIALAVAAAVAVAARRAWLATGFDAASSASLGLRVRAAEWALLAAIAVAVVAAVDAVGALLVSSLLVMPAAIARLFAASVLALELIAAALGLALGLSGLWIAYQLDVPPGPAIATLGGATFATAVAWRGLRAAIASRSLEATT